MTGYDPFVRGEFGVVERKFDARDAARDRRFPISVWRPDRGGARFPLILFSHPSMQNRRSATFLCTHLCSRGYVVAAMDHSEAVVSDFRRPPAESEATKLARWDAIIAGRVPDIRFLIAQVIGDESVDADRIAIAGHSFGGWTALATPEAEPRIRAVVALAPAGASKPRPGILPVKLSFRWGREVPALFLVAENDTSVPLSDEIEIFERAPDPKRMIVLRRADHMHFIDDIESAHERFRTMELPAEFAKMQKEMLPMSELTQADQAHLFTRGLTAAHFDAVLKEDERAQALLAGDLRRELAARGVEAIVHRS